MCVPSLIITTLYLHSARHFSDSTRSFREIFVGWGVKQREGECNCNYKYTYNAITTNNKYTIASLSTFSSSRETLVAKVTAMMTTRNENNWQKEINTHGNCWCARTQIANLFNYFNDEITQTGTYRFSCPGGRRYRFDLQQSVIFLDGQIPKVRTNLELVGQFREIFAQSSPEF